MTNAHPRQFQNDILDSASVQAADASPPSLRLLRCQSNSSSDVPSAPLREAWGRCGQRAEVPVG